MSPVPATERIVIALDAASIGDIAIEMARHMTSAPALELLGLFVEDQQLLEHAKSPLAREIVLSGLERPLDAERLERQMRAQAAQARARFEAAAAQAGARHDFQITRGELLGELLRAATDTEALVVALTRRNRWPDAALAALARVQRRTLLFARESWATGRAILAVVSTPGQSRELQVAARLAERSRSPLRILMTDAARVDAAKLSQLVELRSRGIALQVLPSAPSTTAETIAQSAQGTRLLIVPSRGPDEDESLVEQLLAKTRAALLLVRD